MPVSDSSSVRGMGVAVSVSTSTLVAQRFDLLLVLHAEALLLVDDQQPEVFELHVVGEKPVGADDDVDACRWPGRATTAVCSFAEQEPDEHLDPHRIVRRTVRGSVCPCWLREQRRRYEHRDLLAVHARP